MDIRKKFLTVRGVRYWNRLSSKSVDASSLESFEMSPEGALSNLV